MPGHGRPLVIPLITFSWPAWAARFSYAVFTHLVTAVIGSHLAGPLSFALSWILGFVFWSIWCASAALNVALTARRFVMLTTGRGGQLNRVDQKLAEAIRLLDQGPVLALFLGIFLQAFYQYLNRR
jgi:hypothetical protein